MSEPTPTRAEAPEDSFWITPRGEMIRVDASQAEQVARLPGFQLAPAEQVHRYFLEQHYGGTGQTLLAGAEGFGRAATLGLSTHLEKALGASTEGITSREALHPVASGVGFGAGTVLPLVLAPEAVGGKLAAEGLGELTAPRLIAKAGDLLAEGIKTGVAPTSALGKMATGTAAGLVGVGTENALYGVGDVIHEAALGDPDLNAEALLVNGGKHVLESAVLGGGLGALGGLLGSATGLLRPKIAPWLRNLEEELYASKLGSTATPREMIREMADRGLVGPFVGAGTTNARAAALLKDVRQKVESFVEEATTAATGKPEILGNGDTLLSQLREAAEKLGADDLKKGPAQALREYAHDLEKRWSAQFEALRQSGALEGLSESEANALRNKLTPNELWRLRENLETHLGVPGDRFVTQGLRDFQGAVDRELSDSIDRAGLSTRTWKSLNRDHHVASEAQRISAAEMARTAGGKKLNVADSVTQAAEWVTEPLKKATSTARDLAKEYSNDIAAVLARGLGSGFAGALNTAEGQEALKTILSNRERVFHRVADTSIRLLSSPLLPHLEAPATDQVLSRIDHVRRLATDLEQAHRWVDAQTADLSEHAPNTALSAQIALARAINYVAQTAPQGRPPVGLTQGAPPTNAELAAWHQRYETARDPIEVLSQGVLSREVLETLQAVYPKFYSEVQVHLLDQLTRNPDITYQRGLQLSRLLGVPLYPSQSPQAVIANQSTSTPPAPPAPPTRPASHSARPSGAGSRLSVPVTSLNSLYKMR